MLDEPDMMSDISKRRATEKTKVSGEQAVSGLLQSGSTLVKRFRLRPTMVRAASNEC